MTKAGVVVQEDRGSFLVVTGREVADCEWLNAAQLGQARIGDEVTLEYISTRYYGQWIVREPSERGSV